MRGSRFSKIYLTLFIVILAVGSGLWLMQKYDQESSSVLFADYCQNRDHLKNLSREVQAFQPELAENVYLEETFDQKIFPSVKAFFSDELQPQGTSRALQSTLFQTLLKRDVQGVQSAQSIDALMDALSEHTTTLVCQKHLIFITGIFPRDFLPRHYAGYTTEYNAGHGARPAVIHEHMKTWQEQLAQLRPLAREVKSQIQKDLRTLCQGWKNFDQAEQISRFFQMQCQNPSSKKKCMAEQNDKLRSYASSLESQFKENFNKFKKKWSKVQIALDQMKKRCL